MTFIKVFARRFKSRLKWLRAEHPEIFFVGGIFLVVLVTYVIARSTEPARATVHVVRDGEFKGKSIMGDVRSSVSEAKEHTYAKTAADLASGQKSIAESLQKIDARVAAMESKAPPPSSVQENVNEPTVGSAVGVAPTPGNGLHQSSESFQSEVVPGNATAFSQMAPGSPMQRVSARGPDVVAFPVASDSQKEELGVVLPVGSYVKAKIIAGTDATTGEPDPVLLQLDYSNILPNQHKIDLSGCFMTAKAQADLSTERVKMKTMKLSCVSKHGLVFEKEVNGYVADDIDNKFAVSGPVNSKQDRVAALAFLASVVEGVGKAVQQAQTTQQTTALGGSQAVMTGDERKYLAGGAAANAAGVVAQWYLKQAENLLPSITVGSGRDVWVIVLDNVNLPNEYFKKGSEHDARYSYLTRILD